MKDNSNLNSIKSSNYIMKLDVRDKAALLMILTKIQSGILLMSSVYFRFFQTILPMLTMLNEHEDNDELCDFIRKKFASILRTYLRTEELSKQEQPSLYSIITEYHDINLDPSVKQLETHIVVTLRDIDSNLDTLMHNILDMTQDPDIKSWKENSRYSKISDTLKNLTTSITYTYEDVAKAFFSGYDVVKVNDFIKNKYGLGKSLNSGIDNVNSLIIAIDFNVSFLQSLYSDICRLQFCIGNEIDIGSPVYFEDSEKSINELYSDFGNMNEEAIKRDTHRNGFDISLCSSNAKKSEDKGKRKKSIFSFPFLELNSDKRYDEDMENND